MKNAGESKPTIFSKSMHWAGRALRKFGTEMMESNSMRGTWIDVGSHDGELTVGYAKHNPGLQIYAVEPNLRAAAKLMGHAPNFTVIPMAIAESDGNAEFYLNEFEMASSLLPLHEEGIRSWVGVESHKVKSVITVPTIRLDTLMDLLGITSVDFLKIDTQGMDLAVVRSAGKRLRDIAKITLEVGVAPLPLYSGAPSKAEVLAFFEQAGFTLTEVESQTFGQEQNLTFVQNSEVLR